MAANVLLTGSPSCGKTTLVRRVVDQLHNQRVAGFYTQEIRSETGGRIGFEAVGFNGLSSRLADVRSKSRIRTGRYGVELGGFERIVREELRRPAEDVDLFVIDEIGKMECHSRLFVRLVQETLDRATPVLATVALKGSGFIEQVKKRADVRLITVNAENRDGIVGLVMKCLGAVEGNDRS